MNCLAGFWTLLRLKDVKILHPKSCDYLSISTIIIINPIGTRSIAFSLAPCDIFFLSVCLAVVITLVLVLRESIEMFSNELQIRRFHILTWSYFLKNSFTCRKVVKLFWFIAYSLSLSSLSFAIASSFVSFLSDATRAAISKKQARQHDR